MSCFVTFGKTPEIGYGKDDALLATMLQSYVPSVSYAIRFSNSPIFIKYRLARGFISNGISTRILTTSQNMLL